MNRTNIGWINGLLGVVIFAGSMPATRIAVSGFSPTFLTAIRASIAAVLALLCLLWFKQQRPQADQYKSLIIVSLGVVVGFPLFSALALQNIAASRALVFVALLPLCTAIFGVMRAGEHPNAKFWLFTLLGSGFVVAFMLINDHSQHLSKGDLYMIAAVLACGLGYAEGGHLSKTLGGWQVICWALIVAFPLMLILTLYYFPDNFADVSYSAYAGLAYVSLFSMLIGFFFWYKGLAMGGIAKVGQIQLIQPFIGLTLCAVILGESISVEMILVCIAVVMCVMLAKGFA
ncbi:putative DMT superfamily transporter inner membrane protein [Acinetobacter bouvetii]|uniref:Putative DMT superfamily transporter inner membrane protein n=1 Tax=Acinetobacter bouvetii TaxID=202951 RepID=A0A811GFG7_9GAMM|nr:DMT family transporter [Acinetobacter bouvetii]CAB1221778.1 putative DMT superfamily transporter inner membrane protein [Acinetobacter bouvetii]